MSGVWLQRVASTSPVMSVSSCAISAQPAIPIPKAGGPLPGCGGILPSWSKLERNEVLHYKKVISKEGLSDIILSNIHVVGCCVGGKCRSKYI